VPVVSVVPWICLSSLPRAGASGVVCQAIDFDLVATAQSRASSPTCPDSKSCATGNRSSGTLLLSPLHRMSWLQGTKMVSEHTSAGCPKSEKRRRRTGRKDHGWPIRRCHMTCPQGGQSRRQNSAFSMTRVRPWKWISPDRNRVLGAPKSTAHATMCSFHLELTPHIHKCIDFVGMVYPDSMTLNLD
jgi:hypothetical protein